MYVVDATKSCIISVPYFWFLLVKSTVKIVALTLLKVSSTILDHPIGRRLPAGLRGPNGPQDSNVTT